MISQGSELMDGFQKLLDISPAELRRSLERPELRRAEELRLRTGRAPAAVIAGAELPVSDRPVTPELIRAFLEKATGASLHSFSDTMSNGFIPCRGLRIGICGEASVRDGRIAGYRHIGSLSVRIPGEHMGCCDGIYPRCRDSGGGILILSPPGWGKTTALRELIRNFSNEGLRVSVADERNEISASEQGIPGFKLGEHTDVIIGAPKAEAAMQLLRGMAPQIIAMDEISSREDMLAVSEICSCGVRIIATCHGKSRDDLRHRPELAELLRRKAFETLVTVTVRGEKREYRAEAME